MLLGYPKVCGGNFIAFENENKNDIAHVVCRENTVRALAQPEITDKKDFHG